MKNYQKKHIYFNKNKIKTDLAPTKQYVNNRKVMI